jgi:hypothetical protein
MNFVNDLGAPAAVAVVDIATDAIKPQWTEYVDYGMVALGYGLNLMRKGNAFTDNVGIAAFPLAAKKLYARVRGAGVATLVQRTQRVTRSYEPEYRGAGVV